MELKYGDKNTYKYELNKEQLKFITEKTNRGNGQTQFLFQLVDGDFEKLKQLEMKIKNCFYSACPDSVKAVEEIMNMKYKSEWFYI